jgi:hypothetical protein
MRHVEVDWGKTFQVTAQSQASLYEMAALPLKM